MKSIRPLPPATTRGLCLLAAASVLCLALSGCIVVGGYTSGGGWFLWPGSFGLLLIVLLALFLLRRRR